MKANEIAKNLLIDKTCNSCRYNSEFYECCVDYDGVENRTYKSIPSENTCEKWKITNPIDAEKVLVDRAVKEIIEDTDKRMMEVLSDAAKRS